MLKIYVLDIHYHLTHLLYLKLDKFFQHIIALTVIIAGQTTKINLLIQEVSMLKKQVNENGK